MKFLDQPPRCLFFTGKGGVGKTSIACVSAVNLAEAGRRVLIVSTDPASNVGQVFGIKIGNCITPIDAVNGLAAIEIDPQAWKVFVVMDTAPTGHTLMLLDTTGAYHREVTRKMDGAGLHYVTPMMQLQDARRTKVIIVTLAEPTPVLEAAMLQADRADIDPWAWVINNSIAAAAPSSALLRQRAGTELREIDAVANRHARRYAVVPMLSIEPIGVRALLELAAGSRPVTHGA